jgi:putative transposase
LPHWQQNGGTYFVTFRLADALPSKLLDGWHHEREVWLRLHPAPWSAEIERDYHNRFSAKIEHWLDAGYGSCILRQPDCASIVDETLVHFDGERVRRISSVIMPNHVHVLFVQNTAYSIPKLLHSWKSYTSHKINATLGRCGSVWQKDYFDRLIRDEQHFANCVRYIRRNPTKAQLSPGGFIVYENDLAKRIV